MQFTIFGKTVDITKEQIITAFNKTKPEDYEGKAGYAPYHKIVIAGVSKPVKAVFRNIPGLPHNLEFTTHEAERVFTKFEFELKQDKSIIPPSIKFEGFKPQAFDFLKELSENNTTTYFDQNRGKYKKFVKQPLRLLAEEVGTVLKSIDPEIETNLKNVVSKPNKQRADKDGPYHNYMWFAFYDKNRPKKSDAIQLFFSIQTDQIIAGLYFGDKIEKKYTKQINERINANPEKFLNLIKRVKENGFELDNWKSRTDISFDNLDDMKEVLNDPKSYYLKKTFQRNNPLVNSNEFEEVVINIFGDLHELYLALVGRKKETSSDINENNSIKYWKISPGKNARLWSQLSQNGEIAIGWKKLGDISSIKTYDELLSKIKQAYSQESETEAKHYTTTIWQFKNLNIGDMILANKGKSKIMGVGKVIGTYFFDDSKSEYKHRIKVEWFDKNEREIPRNDSFNRTILELTKEEFEEITGTTKELKPSPNLDSWNLTPEVLEQNELISPLILDNKKIILEHICTTINARKNIIFVGPPGTGKTEIALGICKEAQRLSFTNGFVMTTATADWTTFDTIGGYMPDENSNLLFKPGQFLRAIADNKTLVIDEINRADIDKAFGQLFTLLSGQDIELQFQDENGAAIKIQNDKSSLAGKKQDNQFLVGKNWRIIATMNTLDKASLYQMSYAFMRRFAFIHIGIPSNKQELINKFSEEKIAEEIKNNIEDIWKSMIGTGRVIGPAIIKDIIDLIIKSGKTTADNQKNILRFGIVSYVLPQFEGADKTELKGMYDSLEKNSLLNEEVKTIFKEMFSYPFD
ncbi:DUF2461 family protein [Nanoarchaeota archaeon]